MDYPSLESFRLFFFQPLNRSREIGTPHHRERIPSPAGLPLANEGDSTQTRVPLAKNSFEPSRRRILRLVLWQISKGASTGPKSEGLIPPFANLNGIKIIPLRGLAGNCFRFLVRSAVMGVLGGFGEEGKRVLWETSWGIFFERKPFAENLGFVFLWALRERSHNELRDILRGVDVHEKGVLPRRVQFSPFLRDAKQGLQSPTYVPRQRLPIRPRNATTSRNVVFPLAFGLPAHETGSAASEHIVETDSPSPPQGSA